jgi:hypothetical protein
MTISAIEAFDGTLLIYGADAIVAATMYNPLTSTEDIIYSNNN